jgi:hypothetical protein
VEHLKISLILANIRLERRDKRGSLLPPKVYNLNPGRLQRVQEAGNTKGGSITVQLTSCLTGLEFAE